MERATYNFKEQPRVEGAPPRRERLPRDSYLYIPDPPAPPMDMGALKSPIPCRCCCVARFGVHRRRDAWCA